MKLLLRKDISRLGIVGDVVEVSDGYARNYLLPQHLATEPTEVNIRALAEERKKAEAQRRTLHEAQIALAETLRTVEVTIAAAANEEGALYGSVGPREIAAALREEGHNVEAPQVNLHTPIRRLDNVPVEVMLAEGITAEVKVWVVRSRGMAVESEDSEEDPAKARGQHAGTEAGPDGDSPDA